MADRERNATVVALMLTVGIIAVIVGGTVFAVKELGLPRFFSRLSSTESSPGRPQASANNLPVFRGPDETIDMARMIQLRQWLREGRFEALNEALDRYQQAFMADYTREFALYDAYQSFEVPPANDEARLKNWIDAFPGSYEPHLAAAHYYYARGWQSRGFDWIKNTTAKQIQGMHLNFAKAREEARAALKINPDLMPAYNILIGIQKAEGDDASERQTIRKAMARFPYSYVLRSSAQWASEPRWGGSYALMWRLANAADSYAKKYPVLTALHGAAFYDLARRYEYQKSYPKALTAINRAISFGDRSMYYAERADIYAFGFKDYVHARKDAAHAISLRPTASGRYLTQAKIFFAQEAYDDALRDLKTIDAFQPADPYTHQWRQWASWRLANRGNKLFRSDQLKGALKWYRLALAFDADNSKTRYWLGVANFRLNRIDQAAAAFKTCIQMDRHDFKAYQMLDYSLGRRQQWDEILHYWNAFLKLEPNRAEAYFERSGTYYRKHDLRRAKADLQKACNLGCKEACQVYEKHKHELEKSG